MATMDDLFGPYWDYTQEKIDSLKRDILLKNSGLDEGTVNSILYGGAGSMYGIDDSYFTNAGIPLTPTNTDQIISGYFGNLGSYVDKWGRPLTDLNLDNYNIQTMSPASNGADNKYAAADSWMNAGGFYNPSSDYWNRPYLIPNNFTPVGSTTSVPNTAPITDLIDLNPDQGPGWDLIPYLLPLALGAIGGGALGLFGAGAAGEAAAAGIGELGANATMADIYGALTGQSVLAAPGAATGSALYGAATGADLAAALGSTSWADLFAQPGSMSVDPSASSWSQIYGDLTGQSVAPDWLNTLPNTFNTSPLYSAATTPLSLWDQTKNFLKDNAGSIAKTAGSMFQEQPGQALPAMPDFSSGASGGTQPTQQRSIAQQQQSQPFQLSVPQFNQMPGPQQDYGNYQPPQFMDSNQGWGDPSVFQLSQSTWNPSMANALRSYNG